MFYIEALEQHRRATRKEIQRQILRLVVVKVKKKAIRWFSTGVGTMTTEEAIVKLGKDFPHLNWAFVPENIGQSSEIMSYWPGEVFEDVMICVLKANHVREQYHRQDFFFLNFAYRHDYRALSTRSDNELTIKENDCYIGQPFSGYAILGDSKEDIVIIGVLIQRNAFFREYLSALSADSSMFNFFLDPQKDRFSEDAIHLTFDSSHPIRQLLELMVVEYAQKTTDTQAILKPLTLALLMHVARQYHRFTTKKSNLSLPDQILLYMIEHMDRVTLDMVASQFSYHPNYVSSLLRQKTGKTFSKILLEQRMERALALLRGTSLAVEEIAAMVGYNDTSNFYRAFRAKYRVSPREYCRQ